MRAVAGIVLLLLLTVGCRDRVVPPARPAVKTLSRGAAASATAKTSSQRKPGRQASTSKREGNSDRSDGQNAGKNGKNGRGLPSTTGENDQPKNEDASNAPRLPERRTLADLLDEPADSAARWSDNVPRMQIDDDRARSAGIRKLSGKRLTLYTDMPSSKEIDELPELFDQAFPQWCDFFGVDPAKYADWRMTGFLIQQKTRFQQAGLLPPELPPFQHGYSRNFEFWLYDQPSDYYRRHLLLHEGVHGFMNTTLGACGRPWYMEGVAELLGTHLWRDGRLTLNYLPATREDVPEWGRIRIIKDAVAAGRAMRLQGVIDYSGSAHLETEPYAWCWALAAMLDRHPRYHQRFRLLAKDVLAADFNQRFRQSIGDDWRPLCDEWDVMVSTLEYGHDIAQTAIDFTPGKPLPSGGASVTVSAKAGWQNSGLRLEAGARYRLQAAGRYQVAQQPKTWWCEPGGVTIRYYMGRPLGILLAAVRSDQPKENDASSLLRTTAVGLAAVLAPSETDTLYLKINDSPAELADNAGELTVRIIPE